MKNLPWGRPADNRISMLDTLRQECALAGCLDEGACGVCPTCGLSVILAPCKVDRLQVHPLHEEPPCAVWLQEFARLHAASPTFVPGRRLPEA